MASKHCSRILKGFFYHARKVIKFSPTRGSKKDKPHCDYFRGAVFLLKGF